MFCGAVVVGEHGSVAPPFVPDRGLSGEHGRYVIWAARGSKGLEMG